MSLARWDPFLELRSLEDEIRRQFRRSITGTDSSQLEEILTSSQFAPPVDVYEDGAKLSIKRDVPGIDPKGLKHPS